MDPWEALARKLAGDFVPGLREDNLPGRKGLRDWTAVKPMELIGLAHFMCRNPKLLTTHAIRRWSRQADYPFSNASAATVEKKTRALRNRMIDQARSAVPEVSTFGEAMRALTKRAVGLYLGMVTEARADLWRAESDFAELETDSAGASRVQAEATVSAARLTLEFLERAQRSVDAAWAGFPPTDESGV